MGSGGGGGMGRVVGFNYWYHLHVWFYHWQRIDAILQWIDGAVGLIHIWPGTEVAVGTANEVKGLYRYAPCCFAQVMERMSLFSRVDPRSYSRLRRLQACERGLGCPCKLG